MNGIFFWERCGLHRYHLKIFSMALNYYKCSWTEFPVEIAIDWGIKHAASIRIKQTPQFLKRDFIEVYFSGQIQNSTSKRWRYVVTEIHSTEMLNKSSNTKLFFMVGAELFIVIYSKCSKIILWARKMTDLILLSIKCDAMLLIGFSQHCMMIRARRQYSCSNRRTVD